MAKEKKVYEESGDFTMDWNWNKWRSEPMDKFTKD